jgi:hypothetical protein
MVFLIIYGIVLWIANIWFNTWLASEKNRDVFKWGLLAFFFGLLTTLFLLGAPQVKEIPSSTTREDNEQMTDENLVKYQEKYRKQ